ncbi:hypothetical protein HJ590_00640 [Naumannella sp. ID2617S]|nr:hypothetical protein [Naumannella sp. ID2617S]
MLTVTSLYYLLLILAVVALICYRQLTWRRTGFGQFRLPMILAGLGIAATAQGMLAVGTLPLLAWAGIGVELATGVAFGVVVRQG